MVRGVHGSYATLTANSFRVAKAVIADQPWTIALSPLLAFMPVFTAAHWLNEIRFCRKWCEILETGSKRPRRLWGMGSKLEVNLAG
jgi:hypothetical protein